MTILIVYPTQFYIYAGICSFWGLVNLVEGGDVSGTLMYGLGCAFAYKQQFFKNFFKIKVILGILLLVAAMSFQYQYGLESVIKTFFRCLSLVLIGWTGILLFLPELQKFRDRINDQDDQQAADQAGKDAPVGFPPYLNDQDKGILQRIQAGEKYACIASEMGMSVPTVKRRTKQLFKDLQVSDRHSFLRRYGRVPTGASG